MLISLTSQGGKVMKKRLFVIQTHHAKTLHYDFRLELGGVLKSWAVPKLWPLGEVPYKRLAVETEDHALIYGNFEGEIPAGEYGAGRVEIWDQGEWWSESSSPEKDLEQGKLSFQLKGKKIKGSFSMIRMKKNPKNWLLIKSHHKVKAE